MFFKIIFLTISVWLLTVESLSAQEFTFFNQKIELENRNTGTMAAIPYNGGYYTVGVYVPNGYPLIYFSKIDSEGDVLSYHILDDSPNNTTIVNGRQFIKTDDGNFILIHVKWVGEGDTDIFMKKFTKEGEVLWEQQFGNMYFESIGDIIQTSDGGYIIAGGSWGDGYKETYVVKTDSRGSLEWERTYCMPYSNWCEALSVDFTLDGGYVLGGVVEIEANKNNDMYIIKIDSLGNKKWEKNYGGNRSDPACQLYTLKDGNFLLEGGIRENNTRKNYNAKLDANGEIIWEKEYAISDIRTIQTPLVFREDGGFIGAAFRMKNNIPTPFIMNFDENGNILWTKTITSDPTSHVYITDMDKIEEGYVLTGYKYYPTPQYGWMVTIDEEGNFCEELGCVETIVDIENTEAQRHGVFLQIGPNPVREQATVRYQIPKGQEGVLKVYDYQGRLMVNYQLLRVNEELVLEVGDWSNGVYLYNLEIEGERFESGKLVVE